MMLLYYVISDSGKEGLYFEHLKIFILFLCVSMFGTTRMQSPQRSEGGVDPLVLLIQTALSHHVGFGIKPGSSGKRASACTH